MYIWKKNDNLNQEKWGGGKVFVIGEKQFDETEKGTSVRRGGILRLIDKKKKENGPFCWGREGGKAIRSVRNCLHRRGGGGVPLFRRKREFLR